ncbi:MAG: hypothetical protein FD152_1084, partial [Xanthobacteraceae bacterium]
MDEPRALAVPVGQDRQHAVEVLLGSRAALHGEPGRLRQHHDVGVLIERDRGKEAGDVLADLGRHGPRLVELQRRHAHRLAGFQSVLGLDAAPVHPQFALADDALDVAERELRESGREEAVDPHVVLVLGDGQRLDAGLQSIGSGSLQL